MLIKKKPTQWRDIRTVNPQQGFGQVFRNGQPIGKVEYSIATKQLIGLTKRFGDSAFHETFLDGWIEGDLFANGPIIAIAENLVLLRADGRPLLFFATKQEQAGCSTHYVIHQRGE